MLSSCNNTFLYLWINLVAYLHSTIERNFSVPIISQSFQLSTSNPSTVLPFKPSTPINEIIIGSGSGRNIVRNGIHLRITKGKPLQDMANENSGRVQIIAPRVDHQGRTTRPGIKQTEGHTRFQEVSLNAYQG